MTSVIEYQAPSYYVKGISAGDITLFLCGSIEMGKAEDWQKETIEYLTDKFSHGQLGYIGIFNPRRDSFDPDLEQDINNPEFNEQVNWELDHLAKADIVAIYFDKDTKSPITLLELGFIADREQPVIIYCPEGFHRKGNVDVVAQRFGCDVFTDKQTWLNNIVIEIFRQIER